jgi:transposase
MSETRQPIELLSDRTATTLAEWLQEHPGVEIISRDRAKAYKEGASRGCPEAIQVADRFHLLQNLAQMLEVVLNQHRTLLKNVEDEINNCPIVKNEKVIEQPIQPPPNPVEALKLAEVRREKRKEKYDQVWALHKKGHGGKAIAHHLGIPERKGRSDKGRGKVSPYKKYLLERWNSGGEGRCFLSSLSNHRVGFHDTQKLYAEINKEQGYEGSYVTLARSTHRLREAQGLKPREKTSKPLPLVFEPKKSLMTVRQAVWLILRHSINQSEAEAEAIELLKKQDPDLNTGISLAMDFADLVRRKQPDLLAKWLEKAESSKIRAITGFASKLKDDLDAVRNGVTYQWSNGQVEGQVNRLKMLKRQMYGRASHELLKRRFLCPV